MATVHTTARGTEPYDKVYCLGYQVHHEDWSPYPRINKLQIGRASCRERV